MRCTRERERELGDMWRERERAPRSREKERERERESTRVYDVAGCAPYLGAQEGARRSEEAE